MARARTASAYRVYCELDGVSGVPRDGLLFRLAECEMELDERDRAVARYRELLSAYPRSPYALETRFRLAVDALRAPKKAERREAVGAMLGFCFTPEPSPLAEEAALAAATACYNDAWYADAQRIAARMLRRRDRGEQSAALRRLLRWSAFRAGDYAAVKLSCAGSADDEAVYLRAATALAEGRDSEAREGFYVYLADETNGLYRALAKSSLAKLLLDSAARAEKAGRADDALAEYERVIGGFGGDDAAEAMFRKATLEFGAKNWTNACETLDRLLAANGATTRRGTALYLRGVAGWKIGDTATASNRVSEALACDLEPGLAAEAKYFLDFLTTNKTEQAYHD